MKRIRFGVLGAANINKALIPAMHAATHVEVAAIASRDVAKGETQAQKFAVPRVVNGYDALLESDVDAIYIPLPNHLHLPWALKALEAGKHVLVEKPMGLNPAEVSQILELAKAKGLLAMEGFMYRHHPQFARAREIIQSGQIGEVRLIRSSFSFMLQAPENIRWVKSFGGGALYDLGCYCINATSLLLNEIPSALTARARFGGITAPEEFSDLTTSAILEFSKAHAVFECSIALPSRQHLEVVGSAGILELPEFVHPGQEIGTVVLNGVTEKTVQVNRYQAMLEHFALVVNGEAELQFAQPADATHPLAQAKIIESVQKASA